MTTGLLFACRLGNVELDRPVGVPSDPHCNAKTCSHDLIYLRCLIIFIPAVCRGYRSAA